MLDIRPFEALTFDCYGTLIDWEQGILHTLRPLLLQKGLSLPDELILESYAKYEAEAEKGEYRPYKEILRGVLRGMGADLRLAFTSEEESLLVANFEEWRPFPDTVPALKRLAKYFSLNILSNIDDDLFAISAKYLEVEFNNVITAQQIGSYKPNPAHFDTAIERLGLPKERILHVAQSLYHDIAPANQRGIKSVWVNRRAGKEGSGATPVAEAKPDLVVPDLQTLADFVEGQKR